MPEAATAARFSFGRRRSGRRGRTVQLLNLHEGRPDGRDREAEAFQLVSSENALSSYEWGGRTATRFFCKTCGIHCFARGSLPKLGGAYVSVNYNCLDGVELGEVKVIYWDGRHNNWHAGPRDRPWSIVAGATA